MTGIWRKKPNVELHKLYNDAKFIMPSNSSSMG
jgi:hypothetical protein